MTTKESKTLVREIREAIKEKKYGDAIHRCQQLLKLDSKNPMGYLLLGAAYQNVDKEAAAKNLRQSIEYTKGPAPVALQGLANCAPSVELPKIYLQLLDLFPEKCIDYYEKLLTLSADPEIAPACLVVFKSKAQNGNNLQVLQYLGKIWASNDLEISATDGELYKIATESLLNISEPDQKKGIYKRYLKWLYNHEDYVSCIRNACNMVTMNPKDIYAYEWICKTYCEHHNQPKHDAWMRELKMPIQVYAEQLLTINENSSLAMLIKALDLFQQKEFIEARQLAMKARHVHPNYTVTLALLARIYMQLGAFKMALLIWKELGQTHEAYAECLSYENDSLSLNLAIDLLKPFEKTKQNIQSLARCYFKMGEVQLLKALPLDKLQQAEFLLSPEEAVPLIATEVSFESLLLCGKLQFKLKNHAEALSSMLKATRLRPYFAECFDYLGRIYEVTGDIARGRRCFEKCISLNALATEAVDALSTIYQQLGEEELNEALLLNTLHYIKNDDAIRLQYKLGLHFLKVNKCDNAIQCFRTAIKHDCRCIVYWESLGDAYAARGSYNSAIRVFQKILELSPENLYALLQIAVMKTTIRMYPEAAADFSVLLQLNPNYLPGLKGAAEAHIGLAMNYKTQNIYGRSKDHLQKAIEILQSAFLQKGAQDMVWLWRLTANVFIQTSRLPASMTNLEVSGGLAKRDDSVVLLSRNDLLQLAQQFYLCALKVKQNTFLWYELSLCSYYMAVFMPEEAKAYLERASRVCKMAIKAQSNRWQNWNLLGVIYMHNANENMQLAQHCFIQALLIDRKSYTAWTNLGVLYLKLRDILLANEAFKRAQQSSPMYGNAWIGQALVAELLGENEEAFDLFRHCQQFDYHPEAAVGYAFWVCEILSDEVLRNKPHNRHAIEHMYADICALDAVNWYVQNEETEASIAALTLQGFLCARQKLHTQAANAFIRACKLAVTATDRDKLYTNLGYLYLKMGQPEQAVNALNTVAQATFKPIIALALAYYRSGQLQESYSIYTSVLGSMVDQDDVKASAVLVAMASMVYAFQGEKDTKTLLYQCLLLKGVPVQCLFSACALAVLHPDEQFVNAVMSELKVYDLKEDYCSDVSYLMAQYYLTYKSPRDALVYLQKRVRMFPNNARLRKVFTELLLDYFGDEKDYQPSTSQMALIALALGHRNVLKRISSKEEAESTLLASFALKPINKEHSLKLVERVIRLDPTNLQARELLRNIAPC